jgi:hypothetical protein
MMMDYEGLERMYREVNEFDIKPDLAFTTLSSMRAIWGDEQVDEWIKDGTIQGGYNIIAPEKILENPEFDYICEIKDGKAKLRVCKRTSVGEDVEEGSEES